MIGMDKIITIVEGRFDHHSARVFLSEALKKAGLDPSKQSFENEEIKMLVKAISNLQGSVSRLENVISSLSDLICEEKKGDLVSVEGEGVNLKKEETLGAEVEKQIQENQQMPTEELSEQPKASQEEITEVTEGETSTNEEKEPETPKGKGKKGKKQ